MIRFRLFLEAVARAPLTLPQVKSHLTHVSGDSLAHAAHGGYFICSDGTVWESDTNHSDAFRDDDATYGTREDELTFWATVKTNHLVLAHTNRGAISLPCWGVIPS